MAANYITKAIRTYLIADPALTAAIGPNKVFIVAGKQAPRCQEPYIVIKTAVSDNVPVTLCYPDGGKPIIDVTVVTIGEDQGDEAEAISILIYNRLNYFKGTMDGIKVWQTRVLPPVVLQDPNLDDRTIGVNQVTIEYNRP